MAERRSAGEEAGLRPDEDGLRVMLRITVTCVA
jgi:hypothetical protein